MREVGQVPRNISRGPPGAMDNVGLAPVEGRGWCKAVLQSAPSRPAPGLS